MNDMNDTDDTYNSKSDIGFLSTNGRPATSEQLETTAEEFGLTVEQYQAEISDVIEMTIRIFAKYEVYPLVVELARPDTDDLGQECLAHKVVYHETPELTRGLVAINAATKEWETYMNSFKSHKDACLCPILYPEKNEVVIYIYD